MLGFYKFFKGNRLLLFIHRWQPHENPHLTFMDFLTLNCQAYLAGQDTEVAFFCPKTACLTWHWKQRASLEWAYQS